MGRLKLDIPTHLPFATELALRVTDMNYANHLGNDRVLTLMHEARARYFVHYGYTELACEGTSFMVADAAIVFKNEGFFGQTLIAEVGIGDFARVSFDMYYRFLIKGTDKVLAYGKTGMVCYDFEKKKINSVPKKLIEVLGDSWEAQE